MRKLYLFLAGASALAYAVAWAGSAMAEGSQSKAQFEGLYFGVGLGYTSASTDSSPDGPLAGLLGGFGVTAGGDHDEGGVRVNGELLYRHALSEMFYIGVGAEVFYSGAEPGGSCQGSVPGFVSISCATSDKWGGDVSAHLGADVLGALAYVRGGYGLADYENTVTLGAFGGSLTIKEDGCNPYWVVGGGLEIPLTDSVNLALEGDWKQYDNRGYDLGGLLPDVVSFEDEEWSAGVKLRAQF